VCADDAEKSGVWFTVPLIGGAAQAPFKFLQIDHRAAFRKGIAHTSGLLLGRRGRSRGPIHAAQLRIRYQLFAGRILREPPAFKIPVEFQKPLQMLLSNQALQQLELAFRY
jgi:hypothetical protein